MWHSRSLSGSLDPLQYSPQHNLSLVSMLRSLKHMRMLDFDAYPFPYAVSRAAVKGISRMRRLESLRLCCQFASNAQLWDEFARCMKNVCWRRLTSLFLCKNRFSKEVYKDLCGSLNHLPHLRNLHLDDCGLRSVSAEFAAALQCMHELETLGLCENVLRSVDMKLLEFSVSGGSGLRRLKALELHGNPIEVDGAHALAASIRDLRQIVRVSLRICDVGGPQGVEVLEAVFRDTFGFSGKEQCGVFWDCRPEYLCRLDGSENWGSRNENDGMHELDEYASDAGDAWSEAGDEALANSCSSSAEGEEPSSEAEGGWVQAACNEVIKVEK